MPFNMTRRSAIHGAALLAGASGPPAAAGAREAPDAALQEKLGRLADAFHGVAGLYVRHLESGRTAAIRSDELFPTASMIKVSIMAAIFDRIEQAELGYHQKLEYDASHPYRGMNEDLLASFKLGVEIRLSKLVSLMITYSDNTASVWCQALAGGGERINRMLEADGFRSLRINSRTPGREAAYRTHGWGQASPRELCDQLVMIRRGELVSRAASEEMYRVLANIYWRGEALSEIPPWVQAISKQGALSRSRSEMVLVNAPSGDYVFAAVTKDQADTGWGDDNEGFELMRAVSRTIWRHFEPGYGWEPAGKVGDLDR